jgi:hypothetical protein
MQSRLDIPRDTRPYCSRGANDVSEEEMLIFLSLYEESS